MPSAVLLDRIRALLTLFETGAIPRLAQHEVHPGLDGGSRENHLYFTLPVCINFQRSSPAMWASALNTWNDEATRYVFFPEQSLAVPEQRLREDLGRHRLALQPMRHTHIWRTISRTLFDHYGSDPREILREADFDAPVLLENLQRRHKTRFPYLSGPKLSNYWPYILSHYTDLVLKNPHELSIIPDTHVMQASTVLGVSPAGASSTAVAAAWRALLEDSGMSPVELHPVLWNWSRNHFQPAV